MKTDVREFCGTTGENGEICGREASRQMSSEEVIATFMEPRPVYSLTEAAELWRQSETPLAKWWVLAPDF